MAATSMSNDPSASTPEEHCGQGRPAARAHSARAQLDAAWQRLRAAGQAQFPDLVPDEEILRSLLLGCLPPQADWPEDLATWVEGRHPADLYLAAACLSGDEGAIAYLERVHIARLVSASRGAADPAELVQRLRIKLLGATGQKAALATYKGRVSLRSFLRFVVRNLAMDLYRQEQPTVPLDDTNEIVARIESPGENLELDYLKTTYRAELRRCLEQAVRTLQPQQRNLLRMSLVYRMTTTEIGAQLGVNQSTISRWLSSIQQELGQATQLGLRERLSLSREEYESLLRFIRSHLDASLERWLSESGAAPAAKETSADDSQARLPPAEPPPRARPPQR